MKAWGATALLATLFVAAEAHAQLLPVGEIGSPSFAYVSTDPGSLLFESTRRPRGRRYPRRQASASLSLSDLDLEIGDRTLVAIGDIESSSGYVTGGGPYTARPTVINNGRGAILLLYGQATSHAVEGSAIVANFSYTGGRSWIWERDQNLSVHRDANESCVAQIVARHPNGNIVMTTQCHDISDATAPDRNIQMRVSGDGGFSWGTNFGVCEAGTRRNGHGNGKGITLPNGDLLWPTYSSDCSNYPTCTTFETRYTAQFCRLTTVSLTGATYDARDEIIAQDAESAEARQFEEPACRLLQNGEILCFVRDDVTEMIYRVACTLDASYNVTCGDPTEAFPGLGSVAMEQSKNGTIIALTRQPTGTQQGVLYRCDSAGQNCRGPVVYTNPEAGPYEYADITEIGPNILLVASSQANAEDTRSATEVFRLYVDRAAEANYHSTASMRSPDSSGGRYSYGSANGILDGDATVTFEGWYMCGGQVGGVACAGTQSTILSIDADSNASPNANHKQIAIEHTANHALNVLISANGTSYGTAARSADNTFGRYIGRWYHFQVSYNGAAADGAELSIKIDGVNQALTLTGDIPDTLRDASLHEFVIGQRATTLPLRATHLDELKIFSGNCRGDNLYNGRVIELTNNSTTTGCDTPIAHWQFDGDMVEAEGLFPASAAPTLTGNGYSSSPYVPNGGWRKSDSSSTDPFVASSGCGSTPACTPGTACSVNLTSDGRARTYRLYVPDVDPTGVSSQVVPKQLQIMLHGCAAQGTNVQSDEGVELESATSTMAIYAYPDALAAGADGCGGGTFEWCQDFYGAGTCNGDVTGPTEDFDFVFINDMIADIADRNCIKPQVYISGVSDGGYLVTNLLNIATSVPYSNYIGAWTMGFATSLQGRIPGETTSAGVIDDPSGTVTIPFRQSHGSADQTVPYFQDTRACAVMRGKAIGVDAAISCVSNGDAGTTFTCNANCTESTYGGGTPAGSECCTCPHWMNDGGVSNQFCSHTGNHASPDGTDPTALRGSEGALIAVWQAFWTWMEN